MHLFQRGSFVLASGMVSPWKIECDALSDEDWATLAVMVAERAGPFGSVVGVPRGGLPLAEALAPMSTTGARLVVDDVLTTGGSIARLMSGDDKGFVVFARGRLPANVSALFQIEVKP